MLFLIIYKGNYCYIEAYGRGDLLDSKRWEELFYYLEDEKEAGMLLNPAQRLRNSRFALIFDIMKTHDKHRKVYIIKNYSNPSVN